MMGRCWDPRSTEMVWGRGPWGLLQACKSLRCLGAGSQGLGGGGVNGAEQLRIQEGERCVSGEGSEARI